MKNKPKRYLATLITGVAISAAVFLCWKFLSLPELIINIAAIVAFAFLMTGIVMYMKDTKKR